MTRGFWTTLLFGLIGLAILMRLGFWQLSRIPEKAAEIARIDAMIHAAPVSLPASPDPVTDEYRPVSVTGVLETGELHALVSTRDFGAGFRIIAPFVTQEGRRIMIDRGYVRVDKKDTPRTLGPMSIEGNLHWPEERDASIPEDDLQANYWYARDVDKMAATLGTEPILVVARAPTDPEVLPLAVGTTHIPDNHLSYAIQWFLFAAVWSGMTIALLWRIRS